MAKLYGNKPFFLFDYYFCLTRCRPLPFYVLLKTLYFHGVWKRNFGLKWLNFFVDKGFFTNKF